MATLTRTQRGQAVLDRILKHVPADQQEAARAVFASATQAVDELGLADEELDAERQRLAREIAANDQFRADVDGWWKRKQADLARPPADPPADPPEDPVDPTKVSRTTPPGQLPVTREELDQREALYADVTASMSTLSVRHYQTFGEILDVQGLLRDPDIRQLGLIGLYQKKFATQLQAKEDAARTAKEEALREEGRKQVRDQFSSIPHPVTAAVDDSDSALSSLSYTEEQRQERASRGDTVDRATAEYQRLINAGGGTH